MVNYLASKIAILRLKSQTKLCQNKNLQRRFQIEYEGLNRGNIPSKYKNSCYSYHQIELRKKITKQLLQLPLDRSIKKMTTATDYYSPMTDYYSPTTDYYQYSPACVNSFQTNPIQSRQIHTNVHKSLLFTSMREKRPDRFPDMLLLINSNLHNILQVSTDKLT